ncbi:MAG: hypothetical protein P4M15_00855 [Alphaproteobacteria bacterium]|nr:hypothetical protein [Alphaproteobacteria bacterium]
MKAKPENDASSREERDAAALRENLRKRKQQQQIRDAANKNEDR